MLIPYRVDVPMHRWPIANWVIIALATVVFILELSYIEHMVFLVLEGWKPYGLFGHMWLHGDILHLAGNMIFLWVFGNAVCAKVGNLAFPVFYVALGVASAITHVVFDGHPAIGASGAINGVVGAYLVLYPLNDISCALWLGIRFVRFSLSSVWMILLWLAFDIWGASSAKAGIAYYAHLGGFGAGFVLTAAALKLGLIKMERDERSLLQILGMNVGLADDAPAEGLKAWRPSFAEQPQPERRPEAPRPPPGPPGLRPAAPGQVREPGRPPGRPPGPKTMPAAPGGATGAGAGVAAAPKSSGEFVRLRCVCGKLIQAPRSLSGKRARCPACSQIVQIPDL